MILGVSDMKGSLRCGSGDGSNPGARGWPRGSASKGDALEGAHMKRSIVAAQLPYRNPGPPDRAPIGCRPHARRQPGPGATAQAGNGRFSENVLADPVVRRGRCLPAP